jgi:DNA polymerase-1
MDQLSRLHESTHLVTEQIKDQYGFFTGCEDPDANLFDVVIAAYLLNPLKSDYTLSDVANEHLGMMLVEKSRLLGKLDLQEAACKCPNEFLEYAGFLSLVPFLAEPVLQKKLQETGMDSLFSDIEMPLTYILYSMEREGVNVQREALREYGDSLGVRIAELEKSIYEQAGEEFNLNSPKQLGEILFGKLGLPGGKKTKTGYSTAADVLEKLAGEYPMVADTAPWQS